MIPIIDYFFYKLYKFGLQIKVKDSEFSSLTAITLIEGFNLSIITNLFKINIKATLMSTSFLFFSLLLLNYIVFLRRKRYLRIYERYVNEPKVKKNLGSICVILYIVLTVYFAIYTVNM